MPNPYFSDYVSTKLPGIEDTEDNFNFGMGWNGESDNLNFQTAPEMAQNSQMNNKRKKPVSSNNETTSSKKKVSTLCLFVRIRSRGLSQ